MQRTGRADVDGYLVFMRGLPWYIERKFFRNDNDLHSMRDGGPRNRCGTGILAATNDIKYFCALAHTAAQFEAEIPCD
jgi:hypothetical protein